MRYACGVEYNGAGFHGWQQQPHARSVQGDVQAALSKVANHPVQVVCAGRTDSGVHATMQVIHFDSEAPRTLYSWLMGVNANLPSDVCVLWVKEVNEEFHARFSARLRCYRYVILNRHISSALLRHRASWDYRPLDEKRMNEAAGILVGEHDFSSFRATGCQANSPIRTIHRLEVTRSGLFLYIDVQANAFLHHMVRNIAGVLMTVGCGEKEVAWVDEVLALRDRAQSGVTAPADGLYLVGVGYPENFLLETSGMLPSFG